MRERGSRREREAFVWAKAKAVGRRQRVENAMSLMNRNVVPTVGCWSGNVSGPAARVGGGGDVQEAAGWGVELAEAAITSSPKLCLSFSSLTTLTCLREHGAKGPQVGYEEEQWGQTPAGRRSGRSGFLPSFRPDTSFVPTTTKQLLPLPSQTPAGGVPAACTFRPADLNVDMKSPFFTPSLLLPPVNPQPHLHFGPS